MGFILRGIASRSALVRLSDRGCRRRAIIVGLQIPKQTPQRPNTSFWYHSKCHYSLDAKNPTDAKNSVVRTFSIQEREEKLLELLKTPQIRNQDCDLVTESQTILLYYCNQVTLNNNSNKAETALAAQNICKWTQAMLNYLQNEQQDTQEKNNITNYSSVPWEPIVEALSSTHQILFLTFANDLVLTLATSLSKQKSIDIDTSKLMSCLICGWSKCCSNTSNRCCEPAEKAEKWLLDWIRNYYYHEQQGELEFPNILLFGAVMDSWAKSTKREAPFRAERILNLLLFFANKEKSNVTRSNSELQQSSTIKQLISLLEEEKPLFVHCLSNNKVINSQSSKKYGNVVQRPNTVLYTSIIDAWSRSSHPMAANYAEQWLHHMEKEYYEYGNKDARPNVVSYTAVISAFARCSSHPQKPTNNKAPHAANRSESVLLRLLQLSTRECDKDGGSSVQAAAQQLTPDVMAYNSVISAWANTVGKDPLATKNSERWLKILLEEGGAAEADAVSFNSVINAYAREATYNGSKAAKRAEQWFMDMKIRGIEPTTITYGSLIKAWSNSRSPEAPERAEFWLQAYRHQQQEQVGQNRQDAIIVYNSAVNAWATSGRSDSLDGAIRLISEMENTGSNLRQKVLDAPSTLYKFTPPPPDTITYNTLLKGCSSFPGIGSNKVKNGSTHSKLHKKALSIAFKTYNHMLVSSSSRSTTGSRVQPDSHTFSIMLSCISKQTPYAEKRNNPAYKEIIAKIFHDCCNLGMVNDIVLSALKNACSCLPDEDISNSFYTVLTTDNFAMKKSEDKGSSRPKDDLKTIASIHNIPAQWKINVHAGGGLGRSQAPTERAMLLSRQKKNVFRSKNP